MAGGRGSGAKKAKLNNGRTAKTNGKAEEPAAEAAGGAADLPAEGQASAAPDAPGPEAADAAAMGAGNGGLGGPANLAVDVDEGGGGGDEEGGDAADAQAVAQPRPVVLPPVLKIIDIDDFADVRFIGKVKSCRLSANHPVCHVEVADESASIRCVGWAAKATELSAKCVVGSTVEIVGGVPKLADKAYTQCLWELTIGEECKVTVTADQGVEPGGPNRHEGVFIARARPLSEVVATEPSGPRPDAVGIARRVSPIRPIKRRDGSQTKLRKLELADASGSVCLTLWGAQAEELVAVGDVVGVANARVSHYNGQAEMDAPGAEAKIAINDEALPGFHDLKAWFAQQ